MSQYPTPGEVPPPGHYGQQPSYPPPPAGTYPADQPNYPQQPPYGQASAPGQYPGQPYGQPSYPPARIAKPTGWFIVNWLFFWPLAIYSLIAHWNKIDSSTYAGDVAGARFHAAKVKTMGIIALCIGILIIVANVANSA